MKPSEILREAARLHRSTPIMSASECLLMVSRSQIDDRDLLFHALFCAEFAALEAAAAKLESEGK